ncbi:MAG: hypothetical protein PHW63_05440 [Alphaproteobacteria bacterium]|nr:hypothetical protein [Alphaproteobacteria bacterium]
MQALFELTTGKDRLGKIISEFPSNSAHWNEAQNRFQFVDRLLVECLGWQHPDIEVESFDGNAGKADYILGKPAKAVLEAKREARIFDVLPIGNPSIVRKIKPLLKSCKVFNETVQQVVEYCMRKGSQIAIICNGPQLIIFQAFVTGQSLEDGECYLFNGFQSYQEHFPLLWTLLSPEGITENRAYRELSLHRNPRIPPKASSNIPDPLLFKYRNQFQENLQDLASILLEDIETHPSVKTAFYNECYVPIAANSRNFLLSKKVISARYRKVCEGSLSPTELDGTKALVLEGKLEIDSEILSGAVSSRPFVVIGDVGVGKTSFFENLYEQLDVSEKQNTYFIHVNLGVKATLSSDIKGYILDEIQTILKKKYNVDIQCAAFVNSIYYQELRDFDNSVEGALKDLDQDQYRRARVSFLSDKVKKRDAHLHASLAHITHGRQKQIILAIDNADQRTYQIQQDAFLIAQELAATRNLLVFVAVRPSTFYQSKMTGALSGYQNRVLTISPPPADEVLMKRISFALRVAEGKITTDALRGIKLYLKNIVTFLTATLRSIKNSDQIRLFLSNITGGNTRLVIEMMSSFCGSPNVNSEKIVRIEENTCDYKVPLHEFSKHALLGEYAYYNPRSSLVAYNVYDVSTADPREHFLAILLVSYLTSSVGEKDNDGFSSGQTIIRQMASFGFHEDQTRYALRHLALHRLIETPHAHYREIQVPYAELPDGYNFRATSIGAYHAKFWAGSFVFLDATSIDTPIFDADAREKIFNGASSLEIKDRLQRAECFKQYLKEQWCQANINTSYFDFLLLLQTQEEGFSSVQRFVQNQSNRLPFNRKKAS